MKRTERIVQTWNFAVLLVWIGISAVAGALIASGNNDLPVQIAAGFVVYSLSLGIALWLPRRMRQLDERQQLIVWQVIGAGGLWAGALIPAMGTYFILMSDGALAGLMVLTCMATPMLVSFAAGMVWQIERRETGDQD